MDIVSIINYKGGVGKTTVTANLAAELACRGKRVLLLDTDAQSSLTFSLIQPDEWAVHYKEEKNIKSWFDAICDGYEPPPLEQLLITPTVINREVAAYGGQIDLICSHLDLLNVDLELAALLRGENVQRTKRNYIKVHGKLRAALQALGERGLYDVVLIDCPPNFNIVTKNAIVASQQIVIPVKPDYLSTVGIDHLQGSVKKLTEEFNEYATWEVDNVQEIQPIIMGVVFTMVQINNREAIAAQRQFIAQTKRLGMKVFRKFFKLNNSIFGPQSSLPPILTLKTSSHKTHQEVVKGIEGFVDEFEQNLQSYYGK